MKLKVLSFGMVCLILPSASPLWAADFSTGVNWPSYGGTHSALRYSALDQINASNVQRLAPAWVFQTGDKESGLQATPIVIDGVMYFSSASNWVFALDADTGRLLWEYRFPIPNGAQIAYGRQNRALPSAMGACSWAPPTITWWRSTRRRAESCGASTSRTRGSAAATSPAHPWW